MTSGKWQVAGEEAHAKAQRSKVRKEELVFGVLCLLAPFA